MEFTRIIHPVGQGGFYSESLKFDNREFTVVYDCGGNGKVFMENYLKNYFPKKEEDPKKNKKKKKNKKDNISEKQIDAVFISHLHEDHVNGLDFLLNQFHVRYLFLPQLNKDEILEIFLYNYFQNPESIGNSLLLELYPNYDIEDNNDKPYYLNTKTRVIKVPHNNQDLSPYREEESGSEDIIFDSQKDLNLTENEEKESITCLSQGAKVFFDKKWVYIPYNPPVGTKRTIDGKDYNNFEEYFKEQLNLREFSISDLPSIIKKKTISKCKKIYGDFFGSNLHNSYSMTLFSGPVNLDEFDVIPDALRKKKYKDCYGHFLCPYHGSFLRNPNCLYMGDFETEDHIGSLKGFYNRFWRTIASIQVPHHGSNYNYEQELYRYPVKGYISVGEDNKYHHPNIDTLIGMKTMMCEPILVTEKLDTIKIYQATNKR